MLPQAAPMREMNRRGSLLDQLRIYERRTGLRTNRKADDFATLR
jgi:hypothetical protein